MVDIREYFERGWSFSGITQVLSNVNQAYLRFEKRYREPHRYYHTLTHIHHCLVEFHRYKDLLKNPKSVLLALLYHDVIYDTREYDNEEQSVGYFLDDAKSILPGFHCGGSEGKKIVKTTLDVCNMILATKEHIVYAPDIKHDTEYLIDIYLSILGQSPDVFDEYESNIRKECGWISDRDFAKGRFQILTNLLKSDGIYRTELFQGLYENRALGNISRSLAKFSPQASNEGS